VQVVGQTLSGIFGKSKEKSSSSSPTRSDDAAKSPNKFGRLKLRRNSGSKDKSEEPQDNRRLSEGTVKAKEELVRHKSEPPSVKACPTQNKIDEVKEVDESATVSRVSHGSSLLTPRSSTLDRQALKALRQAELARLREAQDIQRNLEEVEVRQRDLENRGIRIEKLLRGEPGIQVGEEEEDDSTLLQEWFSLVHEKQRIERNEQELIVRARTLELEDRYSKLQQELKLIMDKKECDKSSDQITEEGELLEAMLDIVEQKDALSSLIEDNRERYREEDADLENIMQQKGVNLTPVRRETEV